MMSVFSLHAAKKKNEKCCYDFFMGEKYTKKINYI